MSIEVFLKLIGGKNNYTYIRCQKRNEEQKIMELKFGQNYTPCPGNHFSAAIIFGIFRDNSDGNFAMWNIWGPLPIKFRLFYVK